jgi:GDP/UDP-N,N'-diacetylbacillosamine 2-epimerase (hydrolysing)
MNSVLRAVEGAGLARTIIYPNSDRGHTGIIEAIEAHRRRAHDGLVRVARSLDHDTYLRMLIDADVLVGNSSSGIIEAATAGTASVNIGSRQRGREPSGRSVINADESASSIRAALKKALRKRPIIGRPTVYGNGRAGSRIAGLLATMPLDDDSRRKTGTY